LIICQYLSAIFNGAGYLGATVWALTVWAPGHFGTGTFGCQAVTLPLIEFEI